MPNKDSGFHSVSLPDPLLELIDRVAPRLAAKAQDGRRKDSRATAIEFLVRKALKDLADKGLLGQLQIPLTLYDEAPCGDCGKKAAYTDRRGPGGSVRHFCEDCRADRWEPELP